MSHSPSDSSSGRRGVFVSFEGIEGSGKTTQIRRLEAWLQEQGREVVAVREPGGTGRGERIRGLLLEREGGAMDAWCELCLYMAARAQLTSEVIGPALARGAIVLADRFGEASIAYQGGGRGLGAGRVRTLYRWVTGGVQPERVFLLDLDPREGLRRIRAARGEAALDRLESEPLAFHRRVRSAYRRLARSDDGRVRQLDAGLSPEALELEIRRDACFS